MKVFYKNNNPVHLNFISFIKSHKDINQENQQAIESYLDLKRKSEKATQELQELKVSQPKNIQDQGFDKNKKFLQYKDAINYGIRELCCRKISVLRKLAKERRWDVRDLDREESIILQDYGYLENDVIATNFYGYSSKYNLEYFLNQRIRNAQKCIDEDLFFIPFFTEKKDLEIYKKYLSSEYQKERKYFEFLIKENILNGIIYSVPNDPRVYDKILFYDYLDTSKVVATWNFATEEETLKVYKILKQKLGQTTEEILIEENK